MKTQSPSFAMLRGIKEEKPLNCSRCLDPVCPVCDRYSTRTSILVQVLVRRGCCRSIIIIIFLLLFLLPLLPAHPSSSGYGGTCKGQTRHKNCKLRIIFAAKTTFEWDHVGMSLGNCTGTRVQYSTLVGAIPVVPHEYFCSKMGFFSLSEEGGKGAERVLKRGISTSARVPVLE
ncbi:hypothetical protein HOY80DRAFT_60190 [Tuber brumale]|nr:hypothetical protein HOY80DRAFT_60190 [Tuber brumale]